MSGADEARLERLLGGDHLTGLRERLRRRFANARPDRPLAQIRIDGLTEAEHAALASLTGRPQRLAGSMRIDLAQIDASFRNAGIAASLRDALERLDGPILDLARMRLSEHEQWSGVIARCRDPIVAEFLADPAGLGLLRRLARRDAGLASTLCRGAEAVLRRLPAHGITRAQLAAETLGDAHALDAGQPVASLVLAARRRQGASQRRETDGEAERELEADPQRSAERTRALWAAAGVLVNELARPALFLNIAVKGRANERSGEPAYLSLRALLRAPPAWDVAGRTVYVCENPNVVAIAADRLGARCAPLASTDGMPAAAQRTLLAQLAEAGARFRYHGDFDWPGVRIANHVMREHGATPWRFGVDDYLAAIGHAPDATPSLDGAAVAASWDRLLAEALARHRIAVPEEAVMGGLLEDLGAR